MPRWNIMAAVITTAVFWCVPFAAWSKPSRTSEVLGKVFHCRSGPWGDLEYYYVYLEMPAALVDLLSPPDPLPRWNFPGGTEATLRALFEKAALPSSLQDSFLDPRHRVFTDGVLTVFPPLADLMAMPPEPRTVIYRELAKSGLNPNHSSPIFITNGDPDSWFAQSQLRPGLREVVKKMTYMRGDVLCFSDLDALAGMAKSEKEVRDIMRAMSRTRSLVLRLKLSPHSDLGQIEKYWSGNRRNMDIEPIITSAVETEGVAPLDCIHLLPPLARRYLYSYPSADLAISSHLPNCHWTSLNFFNTTPLNYPIDSQFDILNATNGYAKVDGSFSFGDLLMLSTPDGFILHSCVYIADDIVYTKNGDSLACPWMLMKLGDVKRLYASFNPAGQQVSVRGYRLKS